MTRNKSRNLIPGEGAIISSPHKKYEELIVFVHFFGGNKLAMRRHVEFVNSLGFDALTFNLSFHENFWLQKVPLSRTKKFGLRHIWADEIEDVLNAVPGPKIIYAFSNPAASAIDAIIRRKAFDIKALVTDSGPFVNLVQSSWKLLGHQYSIKNKLLRLPATGLFSALWGLDHSKCLHHDISLLPSKFPLLSIRGWEDPLVPVTSIEAAFNQVEHLKFETLSLPEAGHLDGLKRFPDEYKPKVAKFLTRVSVPLSVESSTLKSIEEKSSANSIASSSEISPDADNKN